MTFNPFALSGFERRWNGICTKGKCYLQYAAERTAPSLRASMHYDSSQLPARQALQNNSKFPRKQQGVEVVRASCDDTEAKAHRIGFASL